MAVVPSSEMLDTLKYTPTWVVATVCTIIVLISLCAERGLHYLGEFLKHRRLDALFEALQKLKEELMLLGFISLMLTVFQGLISNICVPPRAVSLMLPCKIEKGFDTEQETHHGEHFSLGNTLNKRRLLSEGSGSSLCLSKGKVPLLSIESLHHLHIFIFVLAVVHVVFCATTMVLGGAKIRRWKHWEEAIKKENSKQEDVTTNKNQNAPAENEFVKERAMGFWRKSVVISGMMSFFKQFYASVTKSDYKALRSGFIMKHCSSNPNFDFHRYMMRALEDDFKIVVGISWYLWLFVVLFLLLNVNGWHTYFWLSFLPLILLLSVGAKLEYIITRLAQGAADKEAQRVKPSDHHFWFRRPGIVLYLIHFILFQNSFEMAFFFWIWSTYGFNSCIMEKLNYIIPRLVIGVLIQVLCSYSTLPLYAIVTQMGDMFKQAIFAAQLRTTLHGWAEDVRKRKRSGKGSFLGGKNGQSVPGAELQLQKTDSGASGSSHAEKTPPSLAGLVASAIKNPETPPV
ncbi:mlo protein [Dioscorea alata]|uniref:Mlo protein n=1 Tax=Dioscorea alata TaxID=55571 RepID=A0ACB7WMS2_DIOAL|nr:mlo protein [Dioscorea alata]